MIHRERTTHVSRDPEVWRAGNQLKNHLAATLAHELRSPLASILTSLQAMRDRRVDEVTARQARDRAERQALHMALIIKDVLAICHADQGKLALRTERVDVAAVIADALEIVGPFLTAPRHHLT